MATYTHFNFGFAFEDNFDFDLIEKWNTFIHNTPKNMMMCWYVDTNWNLVANPDVNCRPEFFAENLAYICVHFAKPNGLKLESSSATWSCLESEQQTCGVLNVSNDSQVKLISVSSDGVVSTTNYTFSNIK